VRPTSSAIPSSKTTDGPRPSTAADCKIG
jgi:hypothetical protein